MKGTSFELVAEPPEASLIRQFRESNNPYDPKFETPALGKATVGPLKQVPSGPSDETTTDKPDPAKNDQQR